MPYGFLEDAPDGAASAVDGSTNAYGYAILMVQPGEIPGTSHTYPKATGAHRVSWFLAHGSLPPAGLQLDHLCHNEDAECPGVRTGSTSAAPTQ